MAKIAEQLKLEFDPQVWADEGNVHVMIERPMSPEDAERLADEIREAAKMAREGALRGFYRSRTP